MLVGLCVENICTPFADNQMQDRGLDLMMIRNIFPGSLPFCAELHSLKVSYDQSAGKNYSFVITCLSALTVHTSPDEKEAIVAQLSQQTRK